METTAVTQGPGPASSSRSFNLLLMIPFLLLFYIQIAHHQPWRDEENAWGVVCNARSLAGVVSGFHHDGHPGLWYFWLYPFSRLSHSIAMLKVAESVIATGSYLMLGLTTPLRRSEQVLLYLSSYVFFEYTVMLRMYGMILLFTLLYLYGRTRHPQRMLLNTFWLGLIANADTMGFILSGALLVEYLLDRLRTMRRQGTIRPAVLAGPAILYGAMLGLAMLALRPAPDMSWRTTGHISDKILNASSFARAVLSWLVLPFFPIDTHFPRPWWNVLATVHFPPYLLLLPVTVACLYLLTRHHLPLQLLLLLTAVGGILFSFFVYTGSLRHFGILFLAFLVAVWLLRFRGEPVSRGAYLLFALSALGGLATAYGQWSHPFADDQDAALWLRTHGLGQAALIGMPDTHVIGLAEQLQRPMYQLDCRCTDTYLLWSTRRDNFDSAYQTGERLAEAVHRIEPSHPPAMVFVTNVPLTPGLQVELIGRGIQATLLTAITAGDIDDEHFWIYRVGEAARP